jgi:hypothetical protein
MPTEPQPLTVSEAVHAAVEACDDGSSEALDELLLRFEDEDEPITGVEDIEQLLERRVGPIEEGDPAFQMACAVVIYLAHRRDEISAEADELLRLAARSEFNGSPPPEVADWLQLRGVTL